MTQVVSSISGLQVYAPSAGYAPTNNADVSAIASGYQVVSSTATQLYAGTAYLTSVNDAPVSASRAGNAANASLANSAYYDGTGRLISSLPDSAAVSAIASSYAESAASGKQDTLTFAYDDDKISSINGSALAGQGGVTGDYVEKSATEVAIGSANVASYTSLAQGISNTAYRNSFAQGYRNSASYNSFAQGTQNSAYLYSFAQGYGTTAKNTAAVFGANNLRGDGDTATGHSAAFVIGDGSLGARHDLMLVTRDGEITMFSSTADTTGTGIMSSLRAISAAATGGGVDSATVSAIASSYAESAASSKQDALTFDWDADSAISSINGSALAGQGGGAPVVVTGTAWDPDTSAYVYPTSNLSAAERRVWEWQGGNKSDYIEYLKDDSGNRFPMMAHFLEAGAEQRYYGSFAQNGRLQFSPSVSMFTADGSNKYGLLPLTYATGASMNLSAGYFRASYRGDTVFISRGPTGTIDSSNSSQIKAVRIEAHNSRGANISAYGSNSTGYYGDTGMKLSHSGVFVDDSGNSSNTASNLTLTTGSITFNSAGSSDVMSQSSIPYWNEKIDGSALGWLEV